METKQNWHCIIQTHVVLYMQRENDNMLHGQLLAGTHPRSPVHYKGQLGPWIGWKSGAKYQGCQLSKALRRPGVESFPFADRGCKQGGKTAIGM